MPNKIDKWYITNLDARWDKWACQQFVACLHGIPMEIFDRFPARIENDVLPSQEELARRIAADGFPEWEEIFATRPVAKEHRDRPELTIQHIACEWTRMSVLRHIVESGYRSVVCTDNGYLNIRYEELTVMFNKLPDDLLVLYFYWYCFLRDSDGWDAVCRLEPSGVPGVLKNFSGGGFNAYWTPKGAGLFLDLWRKNPKTSAENLLLVSHFDSSQFYACDPHLVVTYRDIGLPSDNPLFGRDH